MVKTTDLTKGPVGKTLFRLTLPMLLGMFSMMAFNLADTYFVSRLGTDQLAAMTFTFPVVMMVISIALGLGVGTSSVISRVVGNGDRDRVRRLTTDSLFLAVILGVVFIAAGLLTMEPIFYLMGARGDILKMVKQYMTIWYLGVGFVVIPMVGNNAIRASGDTLIPGLIMTFASMLNIILDPIFIFGLFGFPRLELAGAAVATVLTRAITLVAALYILNHRKRMLAFVKPRMDEIKASWNEILYVGFPASATNVFFSLTMGVITRIIAIFGPAAVAAVGAGIRIEALFMMVYFAMMTAIVPFIGQNWGAKEYCRVHEAQGNSNIFSVIWGAAGLLFFLFFAGDIGRLFSSDPYVVRGIRTFLVISSIGYGMRGVCMIAVSFFNAINRPINALNLNLVRMFFLYIPLSYFGAFIFGLNGVFWGMTSANIIAGAAAFIWVKRTRRACEKM